VLTASSTNAEKAVSASCIAMRRESSRGGCAA
jgi:hypothetical protein